MAAPPPRGEDGPWATPLSQSLPTARAVMAKIYGVSGPPKKYSEYKARRPQRARHASGG
jgi:hypothetical protein